MEHWKRIPTFPRYEVSDRGRVRNIATERIMRTKINQYGVVGVGLMGDDGIQYHRSLSLIVAMAFLEPAAANFDVAINIDGDRHNNAVENLAWRPRWYAIRYNQQFDRRYENPITAPVRDRNTGDKYRDSWHVATTFGLLERDVVLAIMNRTYVWPTFQEFEVAGF